MCGFVVSVGKSIDRASMHQALSSIRYRGPDETGIWDNPRHNVCFGHVRLNIIDLKTGHQPITNHDESLVAVVNGEFYGYQAIRESLAKDGYRFKTASDSEIILGLYERHGVRALQFLRGEFAFVLWDEKNRLVFAARDYFGVKPLFYLEEKDAIYFASEAKAFKALDLPLSFGEENFFQALCLIPHPEETIFSGIKQIPPANYLIKSTLSHSGKVQAYWDFNYPKAKAHVSNLSIEEAAS
ncbi:MAG TPA: asparagine synthetase B, partial [Myxococcota bacterium]|nr:asparagine synthetase B [Myxococcota bacterium]